MSSNNSATRLPLYIAESVFSFDADLSSNLYPSLSRIPRRRVPDAPRIADVCYRVTDEHLGQGLPWIALSVTKLCLQ